MKLKGNDIRSLLFWKELELLAGSGFRNFITLFVICFLSLFAVSIAWNSDQFLEMRMNDPYTNLLEIPKLVTLESEWGRIKNFLNNEEVQRKFAIESVSGSSRTHHKLFSKDLSESRQLSGKTFHPESDQQILEKILGTDQLDTCNFSRGIVISENALYDLGYTWQERNQLDTLYLKLDQYNVEYEEYVTVPLSLIKVVNQLPHRSDFIIHPNLNNLLNNRHFFKKNRAEFGFKVLMYLQKEKANSLLNKISQNPEIDRVEIVKHSDKKSSLLSFSLKERQDFKERFQFFRKNIATIDSSASMIFLPRNTEFYWQEKTEEKEVLNYIVNFKKLSMIRPFANALKNQFYYPVDLSSVETKENFELTRLTTVLLVFCLLVFALSAVLVFINSMFKSHLRHISRNIGTIIAFGYEPRSLLRIYLSINAIMTFTALFLSMILMGIFKPLIGLLMHTFIYQGADGRAEMEFVVFNSWSVLTGIIVFFGALLVTYTACRKILSKTPGDLIYQRIE